jgi:hypothetical protein
VLQVETQEDHRNRHGGVAAQMHAKGDEVPRGVAREEDLRACSLLVGVDIHGKKDKECH